MAVARHGSGPGATLGAMASQIHPVFMLPPVATTWFGGILAGGTAFWPAIFHTIAIFAAVYTAHVKDGYVDFHVRSEDDDHPLTARGCQLCLYSATVLFGAALVGLWVTVGWGAVALTAPTWIIGYLHAPQLDMHLLGATMGYPIGIGLALLGGYYVQSAALGVRPFAFACVFVVLLTGIKIIDDSQDVRYDRSIGKPTVAVVLGASRGRMVATGLIAAASLLVIGFVLLGVFPASALLAALTLLGLLGISHGRGPITATALLIRGSYVFFALLLVAVWMEFLR